MKNLIVSFFLLIGSLSFSQLNNIRDFPNYKAFHLSCKVISYGQAGMDVQEMKDTVLAMNFNDGSFEFSDTKFVITDQIIFTEENAGDILIINAHIADYPDVMIELYLKANDENRVGKLLFTDTRDQWIDFTF
ncbi:MAG: hypothetical protein WDA08_00165 [Weeksellaceae bacterium]